MGIEIWIERRSWWSKLFGSGFRHELTLPGGDFENFLIPLFDPLYEKTGKRIDIYGSEGFAEEHLAEVGRVLRRTRDAVDKGGDAVEITKSIMTPDGFPYHSQLSREFVLKELNQFLGVVDRANSEKKMLRFVGD